VKLPGEFFRGQFFRLFPPPFLPPQPFPWKLIRLLSLVPPFCSEGVARLIPLLGRCDFPQTPTWEFCIRLFTPFPHHFPLTDSLSPGQRIDPPLSPPQVSSLWVFYFFHLSPFPLESQKKITPGLRSHLFFELLGVFIRFFETFNWLSFWVFFWTVPSTFEPSPPQNAGFLLTLFSFLAPGSLTATPSRHAPIGDGFPSPLRVVENIHLGLTPPPSSGPLSLISSIACAFPSFSSMLIEIGTRGGLNFSLSVVRAFEVLTLCFGSNLFPPFSFLCIFFGRSVLGALCV